MPKLTPPTTPIDSTALSAFIKSLKTYVVDQVGFRLDGATMAYGLDSEEARSVLDASSLLFPFLVDIDWDAERAGRMARCQSIIESTRRGIVARAKNRRRLVVRKRKAATKAKSSKAKGTSNVAESKSSKVSKSAVVKQIQPMSCAKSSADNSPKGQKQKPISNNIKRKGDIDDIDGKLHRNYPKRLPTKSNAIERGKEKSPPPANVFPSQDKKSTQKQEEGNSLAISEAVGQGPQGNQFGNLEGEEQGQQDNTAHIDQFVKDRMAQDEGEVTDAVRISDGLESKISAEDEQPPKQAEPEPEHQWIKIPRKTWLDKFEQWKAFRDENGPIVHPPDINLGRWVHNQRRDYKFRLKGKTTSLSLERIKFLEGAGFKWQIRESATAMWNRNYEKLVLYNCMNGNCDVPLRKDYEKDPKFAFWVDRMRRNFRKNGGISDDNLQKLRDIGFGDNIGPRRRNPDKRSAGVTT